MDIWIELFKEELRKLKENFDFIESLKTEIKPTSENYKYCTSIYRRKFVYSSIIISLYGLVENFVEKFSFQYTESIEDTIPSYESLDSKFKDNHFNLSIELVKKITNGKHSKFSSLNKNNVLKKLNDCLVTKQPYKLNKEAFTINTGNLKHSKVCEILSNLNIKNLEKRLIEDGYWDRDITFNKLDDLVERRNEIAHGGNIENFLNSSEIEPYFDFVEKYLITIAKIMKKEIEQLGLKYKKSISILLENVKVYGSNILGIIGNNTNINEDTKILIEKNNTLTLGTIENIENHNDGVTLKLNQNIKDNYKYWLVKQG